MEHNYRDWRGITVTPKTAAKINKSTLYSSIFGVFFLISFMLFLLFFWQTSCHAPLPLRCLELRSSAAALWRTTVCRNSLKAGSCRLGIFVALSPVTDLCLTFVYGGLVNEFELCFCCVRFSKIGLKFVCFIKLWGHKNNR